MSKYVSKITRSRMPATLLYGSLSSLRNLAQLPENDQIKDIEVTDDTCHFTVEKFGEVGVQIVGREENKTIKYSDINGKPVQFTAWVQFKEMASDDTRVRITLDIKLPLFLKPFLKGKMQGMVDQIAERIANIGQGGAPVDFSMPDISELS